MLEYLWMKSHFQKITLKKFTLISILIYIVGDFTIISYIWYKFSNYSNIEKILKVYLSQINKNLDPTFHREIFQLMVLNLKFLLVLMFIFHLFQYISFFLKKRYATIYLKTFVWVAAPGCILSGLSLIVSGNWLEIALLPIGIFYLYPLLGIKYFEEKGLLNKPKI